MARQEIILGTPPAGLGGDPPRTASMKINAMTQELYEKNAALGTAASRGAQTARKAASGEVLIAGFNGIGIQNDLRSTLYTRGIPSDIISSGTCLGFADGYDLGIPGANGAGVYGVLESSVHWSEMSGGDGIQQEFKRPNTTYRRVALSLASWGPWVIVGTKTVGTNLEGAIIERGVNGNGGYTRLADGTQICWGSFSGYIANRTIEYLFAAPFVEGVQVCIAGTVVPSSRYDTTWSMWSGNPRVWNFTSTVDSQNTVQCLAMGRWK